MSGNEKAIIEYMKTEKVLDRFADLYGERGGKAYIQQVLIVVRGSDALMACSKDSIYISGLRAASLQLSVDASTGQAYLVPFKGECTLIVGYKGLYDLAVRTGMYHYINVAKTYEGEEWIEDRITGLHTLGGEGKKSDKVVGWFGSFQMINAPAKNSYGYQKTFYMSKEEIHAHAKKFSKSYGKPYSVWTTNPEAMERKTCLRTLLMKWGYIAPADQTNLVLAEGEEWIEPEGDVLEGQFSGGGTVEIDKPKTKTETKAKAKTKTKTKTKGGKPVDTETGEITAMDETKPWPKQAVDAVMGATAEINDVVKASDLLSKSGLGRRTSVGIIKRFTYWYEEAIESGSPHEQAIKFAKAKQTNGKAVTND